MAKSHYPRTYKNEVVQFYERNHSISETLHEYGIAESTLFEWKRHYDEEHFLYVPGPSQRKRYNDIQAHLMKAEQMLEVLDRCSCGIYASTDEKVAAIEELEGQYSVRVLCDALHLPRGTYYNRKRRRGQLNSFEESDEAIKPIIERLFHENMDLLGRNPCRKNYGILA